MYLNDYMLHIFETGGKFGPLASNSTLNEGGVIIPHFWKPLIPGLLPLAFYRSILSY